jgi:prophage regulatory protein
MSAQTISTSNSYVDSPQEEFTMPHQRLIRLPEVRRVTGFQKSKIYAMCAAGMFPKPLKIANCRASLWDAAAVEQWVANVIKQGGAA